MPPTDDLETLRVDPRKLRPGLRLDPLMESPLPEMTDAEIDDAIAQAMSEQDGPARAAAREAVTRAVMNGDTGNGDKGATRAADSFGVIDPPDEASGDEARRRAVRRGWLGRVLIALSALVIFYTWPWIIPTLIIGAIWLGLIAFIFVGAERIAAGVLWVYRWLDARAPRRAEWLRARADGLAVRLDLLFDRLPGCWTEGLYMPDFSREALRREEPAERPDPFDRLAAHAREG